VFRIYALFCISIVQETLGFISIAHIYPTLANTDGNEVFLVVHFSHLLKLE
jgi:hypothetical protein